MSKENISQNMPRHIAIIMDGNGRWAKKRFLPRFVGHQRGLSAVKRVVSYCANHQIDALTLFAFSTENWKRPAEEVSQLMKLFLKALQKEVELLNENNVRLRIIGDRSPFNEAIQTHIDLAEALTAQNTGLTLTIAANYGGRWDIVNAVHHWQQNNPTKSVAEMTEADLSASVCLADLPEPDLLIRTGGEQRISNFLIWQMAYAEFYFTDELWPEIDEQSMDRAVASFKSRERRFGQTSEQVADVKN
ncbi:isoprenyl transferase [Thiosulfativibrio zosterae]|uniref:Ditrans,polycis-undecaprenyl-diphosphate synthase ((2E,6E)-farnesyl-diphosphate specific) n=2 Tax=Thiosulfativibrio zosterae TaxID=2675053 RepID=A0A6F8PNG1_9GAMM|nr:isoprenyl transferase [Thiosulfativibrio zosterae]BBP43652.1 isoprenyl transferase [Thiosulfativibrio zosterae]